MELLQEIDLKIFGFINGLSGNIKIVDEISLLFANDYFVPVSIGLVLLFHWIGFANSNLKECSQRRVIKSIVVMVIANAIILLLNQIIFRERPFIENEVNLLFYMPTDSSFPSNACAGSVSLALGFFDKKWIKTFLLLFVLAILMSTSRIYVGIHYPTDILAGIFISVISYFIGNYISNHSLAIQRKGLKILENINMA
jgi:undecaprenyl-diphosphatase